MNIQREIQAIKARLENIEAFLSGDQSQGSSHASGDVRQLRIHQLRGQEGEKYYRDVLNYKQKRTD
jgi:hypothetical protein